MFLQRFRSKKLYIPLLVGVAGGGLLLSQRRTGALLLADAFFVAALLYMIVGLWRLVVNLGLFNSTKYGFKTFWRVFLNKKKKEPDAPAPDYAEYAASQKHQEGMSNYMVMAAVSFLISLCFGTLLS